MRRKNSFRIINPNPIIPTSIYFQSTRHVYNPSTHPRPLSQSASTFRQPQSVCQPFHWAKYHSKCRTAYWKPPAIDATTMANAINDLVKSNLPSRVKSREPDPFDGSDPKKLHTFLLQCKVNF